MNCYYHPDTTIVATCSDCSKGLCKSCSDKFSIPICSACGGTRIAAERNEIMTGFAWMIGIAIAGLLLFNSPFVEKIHRQNPLLGGVLYNIVLFYSFIAIVVGWRTLDKLTSRYFLSLPLIGWLFYFSIKLYAAMIVGIFVAPFRIVKNFRRLAVLNNLSKM